MVLQRIQRRDFLQTLGLAIWGIKEAWGASGSPAARISKIETIALKDADKYDLTLVRVRTDAGVDGVGQAESPSLVIDSIIKTAEGLENLLKMMIFEANSAWKSNRNLRSAPPVARCQ